MSFVSKEEIEARAEETWATIKDKALTPKERTALPQQEMPVQVPPRAFAAWLPASIVCLS